MKHAENLNNSKLPKVIRDKSLNELSKVVLFPKKVQEAKETLARVGLPKEFIKKD